MPHGSDTWKHSHLLQSLPLLRPSCQTVAVCGHTLSLHVSLPLSLGRQHCIWTHPIFKINFFFSIFHCFCSSLISDSEWESPNSSLTLLCSSPRTLLCKENPVTTVTVTFWQLKLHTATFFSICCITDHRRGSRFLEFKYLCLNPDSNLRNFSYLII